MSVQKKLLSGLKWSALSKAASQFVSWIFTIYIIRLLAPADYGLMAMATVVIALLSTFSDFGLGNALIQTRELTKSRIGSVYGMALCMGILLTSLLVLASQWLSLFFNEPRLQTIIVVLSLQFLINAIGIVPECLLSREMLFKRLALVDLCGILVSSLSTFTLAYIGWGVWALVLGNMLAAITRLVVLLISTPMYVRPNLNFRDASSLLSYGSYVAASRLIANFVSQADILIGAKFLGKEALGLYSVSLHLASMPMNKAMSTVNQVTFSAISKVQEDKVKMHGGLIKGLSVLAYLTIPAVFGLAIISSDFIFLVLGNNWTGAILPLQLVAIVIPLRMVTALFATTIFALGRADIGFRNTIVSACVMPLSFYIGAHWGSVGLAAAWIIGVPLVFLLNYKRTYSVTNVSAKELFSAISKPLISSVLMALFLFALQHFVSKAEPSWQRLTIFIISGAIIFLASSYSMDRRLRNLIRSRALFHRKQK